MFRPALAVVVALAASAAPTSTACAQAAFDLASWAMGLDPDRPASGTWVVYDGGSVIPAEHLSTLRTSLYAEDPVLPMVAVEELAAYGVPFGEAMLLELARSERWEGLDEDLQVGVVVAFREMRSGRAVPVLARVALADDGPVAREAIRALCETAAPEVDPVLRALIADGDRRKQTLVIRWLRKTGERESAREARRLRREDRRGDRAERKEDRREDRAERREDRQERREDRREDRDDRRDERRGGD